MLSNASCTLSIRASVYIWQTDTAYVFHEFAAMMYDTKQLRQIFRGGSTKGVQEENRKEQISTHPRYDT